MLRSFYQEGLLEAGCDEAGRGCLAGPVVAAAVILPCDYFHPQLTDSKKLSKKQRLDIRKEIKKEALDWGIAEVDNVIIDKINILNASFMAMHQALDQLKNPPEMILVDGNRFKPYKGIDNQCIIKGDSKFFSIAAASVLAKTHRDELMISLAKSYPGYHWETNMGYPTKAHRAAIREKGTTSLHRKSYQLLPAQLELFER